MCHRASIAVDLVHTSLHSAPVTLDIVLPIADRVLTAMDRFRIAV